MSKRKTVTPLKPTIPTKRLRALTEPAVHTTITPNAPTLQTTPTNITPLSVTLSQLPLDEAKSNPELYLRNQLCVLTILPYDIISLVGDYVQLQLGIALASTVALSGANAMYTQLNPTVQSKFGDRFLENTVFGLRSDGQFMTLNYRIPDEPMPGNYFLYSHVAEIKSDGQMKFIHRRYASHTKYSALSDHGVSWIDGHLSTVRVHTTNGYKVDDTCLTYSRMICSQRYIIPLEAEYLERADTHYALNSDADECAIFLPTTAEFRVYDDLSTWLYTIKTDDFESVDGAYTRNDSELYVFFKRRKDPVSYRNGFVIGGENTTLEHVNANVINNTSVDTTVGTQVVDVLGCTAIYRIQWIQLPDKHFIVKMHLVHTFSSNREPSNIQALGKGIGWFQHDAQCSTLMYLPPDGNPPLELAQWQSKSHATVVRAVASVDIRVGGNLHTIERRADNLFYRNTYTIEATSY